MAEPFSAHAQKPAVAARAGGCCEYCRSQDRFCPDPFAVEHILPRSAGGTDDPENLAFSCLGRNNFKYAAVAAPDPLTGEAAPWFHPRRQPWHEHFAWLDEFTRVVGITPTGRATVERLRLNRPGVVNLRLVLRLLGKHPPAPSSSPPPSEPPSQQEPP